jgi:hypothetical protein
MSRANPSFCLAHTLRLLAEVELKGKLMWALFYGAAYKNDLVAKIAK